METVAFPPKFNESNLLDWKWATRQHMSNFKAFTGFRKLRFDDTFVSALRATAFDWYAGLPAGTNKFVGG